jgi:hypothetical protein
MTIDGDALTAVAARLRRPGMVLEDLAEAIAAEGSLEASAPDIATALATLHVQVHGVEPLRRATSPRASDNGHPLPAGEEAPITPEEKIRAALLRGDEILNVTPPAPLVGGWLDLDSLAVLYGRPKSGKSFVAVDLALCVATGCWWHGKEITGGPVLYVAAEGAGGLGQRVAAWRDVNNVHAPLDRATWLPMAVNLLDLGWTGALTAVAKELQPVLIVIDTLNRAMPGGNENGPEDMGRFILAIDQLRHATGACILVVHHSGKDQTAGARGHSSLLGAIDVELEVKNGGDGIIRLGITAVKEHPDGGQPLRFALRPAGTSAAIVPYRGGLGLGTYEITITGRRVLDALDRIATDTGATSTEWQEAALADGSCVRSTFYEQRKIMIGLGKVRNVGSDSRPRYIVADKSDGSDLSNDPVSSHDDF